MIADVDHHWSLTEQAAFLKRLDTTYADFRKKAEATPKKGRGKSNSQANETVQAEE